MVAPKHNDWTLEEGSPFQRTLTWKNDSGNAIDISGWTVRMDVRGSRAPNATLVLDVDNQGWISVTDGPNGEFTIDIPDDWATTASISDPDGVVWHYDIELDDGTASGSPGRVLQGVIEYSREVTA